GGKALNRWPTEAAPALYLALEDTPRRLKDRLSRVLGPSGSPAPAKASFVCEWPRMDDGGLDLLRAWLDEYPDARLVIIDTLAKVRPRASSRTGASYEDDYAALGMLKQVADDYGVAVVVVTHVRKMRSDSNDVFDTVMGTTAITGAADTILVLDRQRH